MLNYTELLRGEACGIIQKLTKNQKTLIVVPGVGSLNWEESLDTHPHSFSFYPKWQVHRVGFYYLVTTKFLLGTVPEEIFLPSSYREPLLRHC